MKFLLYYVQVSTEQSTIFFLKKQDMIKDNLDTEKKIHYL